MLDRSFIARGIEPLLLGPSGVGMYRLPIIDRIAYLPLLRDQANYCSKS